MMYLLSLILADNNLHNYQGSYYELRRIVGSYGHLFLYILGCRFYLFIFCNKEPYAVRWQKNCLK
jgi:hypothetical protein